MVESYDWCTVVLCLILVGLGGCLVIEFQVLRDLRKQILFDRETTRMARELQVDLFVEAERSE